jgi:hypothetical protein
MERINADLLTAAWVNEPGFYERNLMGTNSEHNDKLAIADTAPDRRRPGRSTYTNRFLIVLLRKETLSRSAAEPEDALTHTDAPMRAPGGSDNDLAPAVGILVSVGLGLLLWAIILLIVWPFIHADGRLDVRRARSSAGFPADIAGDKTLMRYTVAHLVSRAYVPAPATPMPWGASF